MNYQLLLEEYPQINIVLGEPLSKYSYTKTGGPADAIAFPTTRDEVKSVVDWTNEHQIPLTILGNLSNLIVRDGGICGVVMILTDMKTITVEGQTVTADSGAKIIDVSQVAQQHALTGLEFAAGIPGSTGGAIFMNAGAYGGEMTDIQLTVETLTRAGEFKIYDNETSEFSYRNSIFQENGDIILGVHLNLQHGDEKVIQDEMDRVNHLRQMKQPLEYPSCGSVFKRPVGYYTGKLIQDAGLQGHRIGGAEISRKHAGFIINVDNATATDYINMIEFIQETIWELNQVALEPEVRIIGQEIDE